MGRFYLPGRPASPRRPGRFTGPTVVALCVALGACSVSPEYVLLDRFFAASRLRDKTALSVFSLVTLEPLQDGIVRKFRVVRTADREMGAAQAFSPAAGDPPAELRRVAELSLDDPLRSIDITRADVALVAKEVTVDAEVAVPDGRTVNKTLVVTLERAVARASGVSGRWIVVGCR